VLKIISIFSISLLISGCKPATVQKHDISQKISPSHCIESQSQCEINTKLANFSLKFSQLQLSGKIKTELPFIIELSGSPVIDSKVSEIQTLGITNVSAYLEGRDMFMGQVPVFFEKVDESNVFQAQSLLANCTEEQMVWRLWVTVESEEGTQNFFVDFTSQRL
jgi:hypothetical protein